MKIKILLLILVGFLLVSCTPAPALSSTVTATFTPMATKTLLPTETFTPEPTATRKPTQVPTEVPLNPDWLAAIEQVSGMEASGKESQFPKNLEDSFYCVVDYENSRSVNYMVGDLQVLSEVDCYYNDMNDKKQHITWPAVGYNAAQDALYQMGRSVTKGLGRPGDAYIENSVARLCKPTPEDTKPCTVVFQYVAPDKLASWGEVSKVLSGAMDKLGPPPADFLATGDPISIPLTNGVKLIVTPALMRFIIH